MTDYTKLTDFASKDALPTGTPAKIVKGTEIDDEFQAIETAIGTKADLADFTTFQGQVNTIIQGLYPVGSVYINASSTTNPSTLLGFGTWIEIGAGKVLVGQDTGDTDFDVMGETGGSKDAVAVAHTHTGTTDSAGAHTHNSYGGANGLYADSNVYAWGTTSPDAARATSSAGTHTHTFTTNSGGVDGTGKNVQPYIVVKMWQRTA